MKQPLRTLRTILACGVFVLAAARSAFAAPGDPESPNPTDKFKNLEFREIGPAVMGGRIDDFAVVESNPNIVYVGTASGGVWKTTNNGTTWEPVFDKEGVSTIGDIAIAPSDPSIVWVGSGEPNNRHRKVASLGRFVVRGPRRQHPGTDLEEPGARKDSPHRKNRNSSQKSGYCLRRGARPSVGPQPGTRRLQNDRWRQDLVAGAENQ